MRALKHAVQFVLHNGFGAAPRACPSRALGTRRPEWRRRPMFMLCEFVRRLICILQS